MTFLSVSISLDSLCTRNASIAGSYKRAMQIWCRCLRTITRLFILPLERRRSCSITVVVLSPSCSAVLKRRDCRPRASAWSLLHFRCTSHHGFSYARRARLFTVGIVALRLAQARLFYFPRPRVVRGYPLGWTSGLTT